MTYTHTHDFIPPTIVISNSRKDLLTSALNDSLSTMTRTEQPIWEPYVETPAEKRANARAQRIAWFVDSL